MNRVLQRNFRSRKDPDYAKNRTPQVAKVGCRHDRPMLLDFNQLVGRDISQ